MGRQNDRLRTERTVSLATGPYAAILFRDHNRGKSLLEIGSRHGEFCRQCADFGFANVTGIDADPENVAISREDSPDDVHFIEGQLEDVDLGERAFDFVICRNVLHHSFNPFDMLDRMAACTREALIIEFEPIAGNVAGRTALALRLAGNRPLSLLGRTRSTNTIASNTFAFNETAFRELLNRRMPYFDPISFMDSHSGHRVLKASKRRIGHLLVVAGPTASGKSTLIENGKLKRNHFGEVDVPQLMAGKLKKLTIGRMENAVFHYDITRPIGTDMRTIQRDPMARLLDVCDRISVVTLMRTPERLRRQFESSDHIMDHRKKIISKMYYEDCARLKALYGQWFEFLKRYQERTSSSEIIVDQTSSPVSSENWGALFDRMYQEL